MSGPLGMVLKKGQEHLHFYLTDVMLPLYQISELTKVVPYIHQ